MAGPTFWADQDKARTILDEATIIRRKLDTLTEVERKISDARVLIELGEAEPEVAKEVQAVERQMDAFELQSLLGEQHGAWVDTDQVSPVPVAMIVTLTGMRRFIPVGKMIVHQQI